MSILLLVLSKYSEGNWILPHIHCQNFPQLEFPLTKISSREHPYCSLSLSRSIHFSLRASFQKRTPIFSRSTNTVKQSWREKESKQKKKLPRQNAGRNAGRIVRISQNPPGSRSVCTVNESVSPPSFSTELNLCEIYILRVCVRVTRRVATSASEKCRQIRRPSPACFQA